MSLRYLVFLTVCVGLFSCKKIVLNALAQQFSKELWENRPEGISCTPENSSQTIKNNELTFDLNHMLCVSVEMDTTQFTQMRSESRFGPSITDNNGVTVTSMLLEYLNQCDVPFPSEYNWYLANATIDGIELPTVGIRKKGFLGSVFSTSPGIKINTNKYVKHQSIGNSTNITFNNNSEDISRIIQCLNYKLYEWDNYPAPRCNLANISVNNEPLGVYTHLEAIDHQFLYRNFGTAIGHLYEGQLADFNTKWNPRWDAKTASTDKYATPILSISNVLENVPDDAILNELEPLLNIDRFITFWAFEILLKHVDGYCVNRNNFFIYFNPNDNNRATFIPWGLNYFRQEEQNERTIDAYVGAELPRRLSRLPTINEKLNQELARLLTEVWNEDNLLSLTNDLSILVQTAQNDPEYSTKLNSLKSFIRNRRLEVEEIIRGGIPLGNEQPAKQCNG